MNFKPKFQLIKNIVNACRSNIGPLVTRNHVVRVARRRTFTAFFSVLWIEFRLFLIALFKAKRVMSLKYTVRRNHRVFGSLRRGVKVEYTAFRVSFSLYEVNEGGNDIKTRLVRVVQILDPKIRNLQSEIVSTIMEDRTGYTLTNNQANQLGRFHDAEEIVSIVLDISGLGARKMLTKDDEGVIQEAVENLTSALNAGYIENAALSYGLKNLFFSIKKYLKLNAGKNNQANQFDGIVPQNLSNAEITKLRNFYKSQLNTLIPKIREIRIVSRTEFLRMKMAQTSQV